MLKYILIATNTLQEYFVYRVNFIFWRIQVFVSFLIFYTLWYTVSLGKPQFGSYSTPELYSYFIIGYIIRALVFTTRTADIGGQIQDGTLSTLMLKPISVLKYYFSRDLIDKLFNIFFMVGEFTLIMILYQPALVVPNFTNTLLFLLALAISVTLFFTYSLIISFFAFWADNAWSSRFLFGVVFVNLFSGQYIPLDFLPGSISNFLRFTPFPYMFYYPVKIWLGHLSYAGVLEHLSMGAFMLLLTSFVARILWVSGQRKYQSYGN